MWASRGAKHLRVMQPTSQTSHSRETDSFGSIRFIGLRPTDCTRQGSQHDHGGYKVGPTI